jgi:hypothetical protein
MLATRDALDTHDLVDAHTGAVCSGPGTTLAILSKAKRPAFIALLLHRHYAEGHVCSVWFTVKITWLRAVQENPLRYSKVQSGNESHRPSQVPANSCGGIARREAEQSGSGRESRNGDQSLCIA